MVISWYWILKLKARFLSGDYRRGNGSGRQGEAVTCGPQSAILSCWSTSITPR